MIITRIIGGLGNQMFQYAVGRAISFRNGVPLKLDLSDFENYTLREYKLHVFNIDENIASLEDIKQLKPKRKDLNKWVPYQIKQQVYPFHQKSFINERYNQFDPEILRVKDNAYLSGYWQSEQYFKDVEDIIRSDFILKEALGEKNKKVEEEIESSNSVSLHVRRGDYFYNPQTNQKHGVLSLEYYYEALEYIEQRVSCPVYYIFSDDLVWVRSNLKISRPAKYLDHNRVEADYLDLHLLSKCKHHIIANSSFSWWGAWLGQFSQKIVIAPRLWFIDRAVDMKSRYPTSWVIL